MRLVGLIKESSFNTRFVINLFIARYVFKLGAGMAQSVKRLATGWKVRGSNPGGSKIFLTYPDRL